jgi:hypothetical protein
VIKVSLGPLIFAVQDKLRLLNGWKNGSHYMPFMPVVWREPNDHSSDCYFCLTDISGISSKFKHIVIYPNLPSAMKSVPHSDEPPVLKSPDIVTMDEDNPDANEVNPDQVGERFGSDQTFVKKIGPSSKTTFHISSGS